jgi:hypothetical protein
MSSIIDPSTVVIIKFDRSGRTRYTAEYKGEVLTAFQSSSLSAPDFAKQCGIKYKVAHFEEAMIGNGCVGGRLKDCSNGEYPPIKVFAFRHDILVSPCVRRFYSHF